VFVPCRALLQGGRCGKRTNVIVLAKGLLWLLSLLPGWAPLWIAEHIAGIWMRFSPGKRNVTIANLQACYPEMTQAERERLLHDSFIHYVCTILETGRNWYWPMERLQAQCDSHEGLQLLQESRDRDRGAVVLAPHFGAWEYLAFFLQEQTDMAILYKPPSDPGLEKALLEKRRRNGANLVPATAAGLRQFFNHIRAGKMGGLLPDQQPSAGQGQFAPFFGVPALTGVLVPRLVQRTGCAVLVAACERLPKGRYRIHILPADEAIYSKDMDKALAAVNQGVEACISIDSAQYLWSYKRFRARPEGEPALYT